MGSHPIKGKMMVWFKRVASIIGAIAVLTGVIFGINSYEAQFATADELRQVAQNVEALSKRLENKIQADRLHAIQQRLWALEDRYGGISVPKAPAEVRDGYREQKHEAALLEQKIRGSN